MKQLGVFVIVLKQVSISFFKLNCLFFKKNNQIKGFGITGSWDKYVKLWDLRAPNPLIVFFFFFFFKKTLK